jgi:hypothetical protein
MAFKASIIHIRAGGTKHGPGRDHWGQSEYAQAAIGILYPDGISPGIFDERGFKTELVQKVRAQLRTDPEYCSRGFSPISRNTILRAAKFHLSN